MSQWKGHNFRGKSARRLEKAWRRSLRQRLNQYRNRRKP